MKTRLAVLALSLLLAAGCSTRPEAVPAWLTALIRQMESEPVWNPPGFVARYEYRGELVYYLPPHCCDIPSVVYDAEGVCVCHPDGGWFGPDPRCPDFLDQRRNERIIWRDSRTWP